MTLEATAVSAGGLGDQTGADGGSSSDAAIKSLLLGVLKRTHVAVFMYDLDWRLLFVNDLGLPMMERRVDNPVGMTIMELNPSWESNPFYPSVMEAARKQEVLTSRQFGDRLGRWFEATTFPTDAGFAVYVADVDEEERAKQELSATLKRLRRKVDLLNASKAAVFVQELDGTISYWSRGAEELHGWTSEEALGRQAKDLVLADPGDHEEAINYLISNGSWTGDLALRTKDGRVFTAECRSQVALDDNGKPLHLLCTVSQEAEHDRTLERQFRAQRLESIGLLAGGIAHNLNNVLAPLLLSAQYVAANESNPALKTILESMEPTIKRGAEMISQVLTYSRGNEGERAKVDTRLLIDELEGFCRGTLSGSIKVLSKVDLDHPFFIGDSTQIMQVLANLVTNARDAMPGGGTITIRAYNHDVPPSVTGGGADH